MLVPPAFPIVIGVTGHIDVTPSAEPEVRKTIESLLYHWRKIFRGALHVMTALADGADQIVADEAWRAGIPIIAVLPMPMREYEKTVTNKQNLHDHWDRAMIRLVLPKIGAESQPYNNDLQFEQLALLLARRSHLLLALWDGTEDVGNVAGTSAVVRMRRNGEQASLLFEQSPLFAGADTLLDLAYRGPLLHVFTPREKTGLSQPRTSIAGSCYLMCLPEKPRVSGNPSQEGKLVLPEEVYARLLVAKVDELETIRRLNSEMDGFDRRKKRIYHEQIQTIKADVYPVGLSRTAAGFVDWLAEIQASADTMARLYQEILQGKKIGPQKTQTANAGRSRFSRILSLVQFPPGVITLFALTVPLNVFIFEIYAHFGAGVYGLIPFLCAYGFPLLFYKYYIKKYRWQEKFQDHRALAEPLRIQIFWGLSKMPIAVSDHYLRKQGGELGWVRFALRGPALWSAALASELQTPCYEGVAFGWIGKQVNYFAGNAERHKVAHETSNRRVRILLTTGLLPALMLLLFELIHGGGSSEGHGPKDCGGMLEILHHVLIALTVFLPATAACFKISGELRAHEPQAHSYTLMHELFSRAQTEASRILNVKHTRHPGEPNAMTTAFHRLVSKLGREALAENAEWLVEHRHRPIEPQPA